jgi:hypothetical protein
MDAAFRSREANEIRPHPHLPAEAKRRRVSTKNEGDGETYYSGPALFPWWSPCYGVNTAVSDIVLVLPLGTFTVWDMVVVPSLQWLKDSVP